MREQAAAMDRRTEEMKRDPKYAPHFKKES
jgi:hypothetical protein